MNADRLKSFARISAVAAGLVFLAACSRPFEARVQSFQVMPQAQGQSFRIAALNPESGGGLEFESYAELVKTELRKHGYQPAAASADAQLTVLLDYGSGPGRERIATRPGSYSGWGWGGRGWYYPGWYSPWYGPWGWGGPWGSGWDTPEVYSYTVYPAFLHIVIQRAADAQPLFEGRAESTTRVNDLPSVMPNLVQALFTDFPGTATRSKVVRIPANKN